MPSKVSPTLHCGLLHLAGRQSPFQPVLRRHLWSRRCGVSRGARPPQAYFFPLAQVRPLLLDFTAREEEEHTLTAGLGQVLTQVERLLSELEAKQGR